MTRDGLVTFIAAHKEFKVVSQSIDAGGASVRQETIVSRQRAGDSSVTKSKAIGAGTTPTVTNKATSGKEAEGSSEQVEHRVSTGKHETMIVARMVRQERIVGYHNNAFGGQAADYGVEWVEGSRIQIELQDDVVTHLEG